jgi:F-type H+-transporting ATPase subunit a
VFGFIFLRGPTPHIVVAAEPIFDIGSIEITNTMITSWIIVAFLIVVVVVTTRRWDIVPSGVQNVVEAIGEAFYNVVVGIAGEKSGRRFFPVVATIFFMIVAFNWIGLLPFFGTVGTVHEEEHGFVFTDCGAAVCTEFSRPGQLSSPSIDEDDADAHEQYEEEVESGNKVGELFPFLRAPASDLNTPLALAIVSAIAVETWALRTLGIGYGKKFFALGGLWRGITGFNFGQIFSGIIEAFVGILELISELVRLVSFTFRLFGNVFAGEVVLLMFTFLTPVVLTVPFYGLEIFVGVIQAFIFAALTLVFAMMAVEHGGHEEHDEEHDEEHGTYSVEAGPEAATP